MSIEGLAKAAIFLLGVPYIVLGMIAYQYLVADANKMSAAGPWWALYEKNYNEAGKRVCIYGKVLLFLNVLLLIAWFFK